MSLYKPYGGEEGGHEDETLNEWIAHHLQDTDVWLGAHLPQFDPVTIFGISFDFSITSHILMLWIASLILITMFWVAFRKPTLVPRGLAGVLETLVLYIRDEMAIPNMGKALGTRLTPFLATLFFFILTLNLMGLIPLFTTATGNIAVTAGLAIITFVITQIEAVRSNGVKGYLAHFAPSGVPPLLYVIIVPIEILGLFTKPFALAMRLFANMIAGHTIIYALLGLIIVLGTLAVAPVSILFALIINFLELFVAFLQAYIFTMLSALFIGMGAAHDH